ARTVTRRSLSDRIIRKSAREIASNKSASASRCHYRCGIGTKAMWRQRKRGGRRLKHWPSWLSATLTVASSKRRWRIRQNWRRWASGGPNPWTSFARRRNCTTVITVWAQCRLPLTSSCRSNTSKRSRHCSTRGAKRSKPDSRSNCSAGLSSTRSKRRRRTNLQILDAMIDRILEFSLRQRAIGLFAAVALLAGGLWSALNLPIDAVPDITGVQVQINTEVPALAAEESEKHNTRPIEIEMAGLPGMEEMRSLTKFGLSQVTLNFRDGTDIFRARQLVSERLQGVLEKLPPGASAKLAPI